MTRALPEPGRVHCGDALRLMAELPDESVAVLLADPPFGAGNMREDLAAARAGSVAGARVRPAEAIEGDAPHEYMPLMCALVTEARRVLRKDGAFLCFCGGGGPATPFADLLVLVRDGLEFDQLLVWSKLAAGPGLGWVYRRSYEQIVVAHRQGGTLRHPNPDRTLPNVLTHAPVRDRVHPNEKPVPLLVDLLELHAAPGDLVLDPFAGSGSTGIAADELGLPFIGFELDPQHAENANVRLQHGRTRLKGMRAGQGALTFTE